MASLPAVKKLTPINPMSSPLMDHPDNPGGFADSGPMGRTCKPAMGESQGGTPGSIDPKGGKQLDTPDHGGGSMWIGGKLVK
jgi:hypothetical protein